MTPDMIKHGTLSFITREKFFIFRWSAKLFVRRLNWRGYASTGVLDGATPPFKYTVRWRE